MNSLDRSAALNSEQHDPKYIPTHCTRFCSIVTTLSVEFAGFKTGLELCRERRLAAVQTTYGALLPAPSLTYSDMSTTIALSDAAMASSYEVASMMADDTGDSSPNGASADHLLFGSFDDDEQVCISADTLLNLLSLLS